MLRAVRGINRLHAPRQMNFCGLNSSFPDSSALYPEHWRQNEECSSLEAVEVEVADAVEAADLEATMTASALKTTDTAQEPSEQATMQSYRHHKVRAASYATTLTQTRRPARKTSVTIRINAALNATLQIS